MMGSAWLLLLTNRNVWKCSVWLNSLWLKGLIFICHSPRKIMVLRVRDWNFKRSLNNSEWLQLRLDGHTRLLIVLLNQIQSKLSSLTSLKEVRRRSTMKRSIKSIQWLLAWQETVSGRNQNGSDELEWETQ